MKIIFKDFNLLKKSLLLIGFLCSAFCSHAQLMFEKDYSNFVRIRKMAITSDGGTIVAGKSAYLGNNDMAMMKLDADGNVEWAHAYGNGTEDDQAESVIQTLDGGYILVGSVGAYCYTVKTNSLGVLQWQKTHTPSASKRATDVTQLPDSSYIITVGSNIATSSISSDAGFMRLDKAGNLLWTKSYSSVNWTCCDYNPNLYRALKLRNSSSILMIGSYMGGSGSGQVYFRKTNPAGTKLLEKRFMSGSGFGFMFNGIQTADGNVVMAGYSMAAKIDTSGNVIWVKEYSSTSGNAMIQGVAELPNGNLIMYEIHSDGYPYLIETTSLGVALNAVRLTGMNNTAERNYNMCTMLPTPDGALIIGFENTVKKFPLTISSACSSVSYTFSTSSLNPTLNDPNLTILTWNTSPVKTFVDGNVVSTPTTACSATYCPVVSQPASISGAATACAGSSVTYSVPAVSGASSYNWSLPATWSGTSTGNVINVTVGTSGGTLSVSALNTCTASASRSLAVVVNSTAAVPAAVSGSSTICAGTLTGYSVAPVSGATSYTWSLPGGWTGTSSTNSISATAGTTGGNVEVASINSCGTSASQSLSVSVNAIPAQPGNISGNVITCSGSIENYNVTPVGGATAYSWSLPGGWSGISTTNSISVTAGASGGVISVAALNACGTSAGQSQTVTIGSLPTTPSAINGSTLVCPSSVNVYSVAAVSGAASYNWSLPGGWSGTSSTNTISVTAGVSGGSISVVAVNGCGTSPVQNLSIVMNSAPAVPSAISGSTVVCPGSPMIYSVASVSGATSYSWSLPGGWTGTSATNSITATAGSSGGNIRVAAINSCGTSPDQTLALTIGSLPAMPSAILGNTMVCASSSNTYSVPVVSGATSYSWSLPGSWSGTSSTNSISVTAGTSGGNMSVMSVNGCGTSASQSQVITVKPVPAQPGSIAGNSTGCSGTAGIYSVAAVSGATSYNWSLPGGWTGTSTTNSISVTAGVSGGSITVASVNECGSSVPQILVLTAAAVPAMPGAVSGNTTVCSGTSNLYNAMAVSGASSYLWTLPSGWTGTSSTNTISTISGTSGGNIQVSALNSCGTSAAFLLALNVISPPVMPSAVSGATAVCVGSSAVYSVTAVSTAGSYSWILPSGFSGSSTSNAIVVTAGGTGGAIQVTANNSCGSSGVQSLAVMVNGLPNVQANTSNTLICAGESVTLTAGGATTYTWSTGASASSLVVSPGNTTSYTVTGTSASGCVNTAVVLQQVSACTGMEEITATRIVLYPNPTTGLFTIETTAASQMIISNAFGQEVRTVELSAGMTSIDLQNEAAGIYVIRIPDQQGKSRVFKLIKE